MSFLAKTPKTPQTTLQDGSLVSTYREAETVPSGFGRERFVSHWLCQPYDRKTRYLTAYKDSPIIEICSIAAGYREGPIDFVGKVWRDGKEITNLDHAFAGGSESQEFAITALGPNARAIVHRGTTDAPLSIVANLNAKTGQNHPPMRRHAWIEWIDIDLGQGTTALPDLQVEMGKNTPAVGAFAAGGFGQVGVNPFAAIYALLTSETGLGIDTSYFDAADWAAQCQALEDTGVSDRQGILTYCNPVFKSSQEAAALLSAILANVDGFLFADGGKFRVGWFPSQAPAGGLPEITEHDIEAAPSGTRFPDWNGGARSVTVIFRDFDRHYGDVPALCPAPSNRETGLSSTPIRVERPMIHINTVDVPQAAMIAAEISASRGSAESTVTLPVQKSRAVKGDGSPLMPGDLFTWDYAPHSLDLVMRVVGRRIRSGETADLIEAIPERGQFPLPYVPPVDDRVLPPPSSPGVIDVADVRLWLLPSGFTDLRKVAPLVNRAHRGIYRVDLHMSTAGAAPWSVILDARFFVAKCAVTNGGINGAAATVRVTSTSVDFARFAAQDAVAQADDRLCVLIENEVCSVGAITVVAANTYDLAILRGRRGTAAAAHADTTAAWLFYREELAAAEHAEFYRVRDGANAYNAGIATKYFKLQLFTIDEDGLAKPDDPGIALQLPDLSADESAGYTIIITNEAHTVACNKDGNVLAGQLGAASTAKTVVQVMRGATALAAVAAGPNSDQFALGALTVTNTTATKEGNDTVRCDTLTADTGTIEIPVNVAGAFTITKKFTLTKVKTGATGAQGVQGVQGDQGPVGPDGGPGPGLVYRGNYVAGQFYYQNTTRRDVVSHGGVYYLTNNPAKHGLNTWGEPGVSGDWTGFGAVFSSVATALLLAEDATITKTLTIGTAGAAHGLIQSANYNPGVAGWAIKDDGTVEFNSGTFRGALEIGTGDNKFAKPVAGAVTFGDTSAGHTSINSPGAGLSRLSVLYGATLLGSLGVANLGGADFVGDFLVYSKSGLTTLRIGGSATSTNAPTLTWGGDTNLYRGAANQLKTDDDLAVVGELLASDDIVFAGAQKIRFDLAGNLVSYITESYGINLYGDDTHPVHLRNCALLFGSSAGASFTAGRIYDANGDQILRDRYSGTPADLAGVIAVLQHHGLCD